MNKKHFYTAVVLVLLFVVGLLPVLAELPSDKKINIDIKPGNDDNIINLGSNGVVPVAILSSSTFDATQVILDSIELAGAEVAVRGQGTNYLAVVKNVNGDEWMDLEVKVETKNLNPGLIQDGIVQLFCNLPGEIEKYWSEDYIVIVPPQ